MASLKRRTIDTNVEEKVLMGLIVSTVFCRDVAHLISKHTIETPYMARVAQWCIDYYSEYKEAPGTHIQDIYDIEKEGMEKPNCEATEALLAKISEQYSASDINVDYIKDRAMELIRKQALKYTATQMSTLISAGRVDEAEKAHKDYKEVSLQTSRWEDPLNQEVVKKYRADMDNKRDQLFQLPGVIGQFLGPMERNWLMGFLAPTKRGKSFWLIEIAVQAILSGHKTIFVSLEMNRDRVKKRIYSRLTADAPETKNYIYPVFDCLKNQSNICNKKNRTNDLRLLDSENKKPNYNTENRYRACSVCRGTKDFIPNTWFITTKVERMKTRQFTKLIKAQADQLGYHEIYGSNIRLIDYPAFSANLSTVKYDIDMLIDKYDFIPDVIVIDYADILAPEDSRIVGRERIDQTWKSLKGMTDEYRCLIATASQSNRGSFDKKNVTQTDVSEDIRKISNSDLFLAINQTPQEKKESISRISKIAVRDGNFDQYENVIVLQQLALGQVCLDSCMAKAAIAENPFKDF